jgi:hypothetical protein
MARIVDNQIAIDYIEEIRDWQSGDIVPSTRTVFIGSAEARVLAKELPALADTLDATNLRKKRKRRERLQKELEALERELDK